MEVGHFIFDKTLTDRVQNPFGHTD